MFGLPHRSLVLVVGVQGWCFGRVRSFSGVVAGCRPASPGGAGFFGWVCVLVSCTSDLTLNDIAMRPQLCHSSRGWCYHASTARPIVVHLCQVIGGTLSFAFQHLVLCSVDIDCVFGDSVSGHFFGIACMFALGVQLG
jgi:hypothetical protein